MPSGYTATYKGPNYGAGTEGARATLRYRRSAEGTNGDDGDIDLTVVPVEGVDPAEWMAAQRRGGSEVVGSRGLPYTVSTADVTQLPTIHYFGRLLGEAGIVIPFKVPSSIVLDLGAEGVGLTTTCVPTDPTQLLGQVLMDGPPLTSTLPPRRNSKMNITVDLAYCPPSGCEAPVPVTGFSGNAHGGFSGHPFTSQTDFVTVSSLEAANYTVALSLSNAPASTQCPNQAVLVPYAVTVSIVVHCTTPDPLTSTTTTTSSRPPTTTTTAPATTTTTTKKKFNFFQWLFCFFFRIGC